MDSSLQDLRTALDNLDGVARRGIASAAAEHRDADVIAGRTRMAAFWQALAVLASESLAEEEATFRALEDDPPC